MNTQVTLSIPSKHLQVLILLDQGKTKKEIAHELLMSISNVNLIVGTLLQNFNCRNCTQLIGKVIREGVI